MPPADPAALSAAVATVRKGGGCEPIHRWNAACELLAREFVRLIDAGELVRVKSLEWGKEYIANKRDRVLTASGAFGTLMTVEESGKKNKWVYNLDAGDYMGGNSVPCDSLESGKAKCEAEYRSRLAAALEPLFAKETP